MICSPEQIRCAFLDTVYGLDDVARSEIALGLVCLRVHKIGAMAEIVSQELYLADEYRFEYFGRSDIDRESTIPSGFRALAEEAVEVLETIEAVAATSDRTADDVDDAPEIDPPIHIKLSAMVLNAIDDYVDIHFPNYTKGQS